MTTACRNLFYDQVGFSGRSVSFDADTRVLAVHLRSHGIVRRKQREHFQVSGVTQYVAG